MKLFLIRFLSLFLTAPLVAKTTIDRTAAIINGDVILDSDIGQFKKRMSSKSYQELFGGFDAKVLNSRDNILQLLIEEKIINQQVKKLELEATDQEVEGQIRSILKRNGITRAQLFERLKQLGTSSTEYREGLKRQIERNNLLNREIKPNIEMSEEKLKHFYQRNLKASEDSTYYQLAHILIDNKSRNGVEPKDRAQRVWNEIKSSPEKFSAYVAEYSDDANTVETGGVLGEFTVASLAPEFRAVIPKLRPGSISNPIQTSVGFHLVKVMEKHDGSYDRLSPEKKEMLRRQMEAEEAEKLLAMWMDRRRAESYTKVTQP